LFVFIFSVGLHACFPQNAMFHIYTLMFLMSSVDIHTVLCCCGVCAKNSIMLLAYCTLQQTDMVGPCAPHSIIMPVVEMQTLLQFHVILFYQRFCSMLIHWITSLQLRSY